MEAQSLVEVRSMAGNCVQTTWAVRRAVVYFLSLANCLKHTRFYWVRDLWSQYVSFVLILYIAMDLKLECCQHKSQRLKKAKQAQELQLQAT
jgi:hypothetical protein